MDRAFSNEMDALINKTDDAFGRMMWREGLHSGFYAMQLLRDFYRWVCGFCQACDLARRPAVKNKHVSCFRTN